MCPFKIKNMVLVFKGSFGCEALQTTDKCVLSQAKVGSNVVVVVALTITLGFPTAVIVH